MKIGIHKEKGSYSERWIPYCDQIGQEYKVVNCYDSDIVAQLEDCEALMWHHQHTDYRDIQLSKTLLFALEQKGMVVYPNFKSNWHFDNKVAEKYLFEALKINAVTAYVFYDKNTALKWAQETSFPKVFKLKGGSGSVNVKLVRSLSTAKILINRSFGKGFSQINNVTALKERFRKYKQGLKPLSTVFGGLYRFANPTDFVKLSGLERGYIYFQDFIPQNKFDTRIMVVGDRAFGLIRYVRKNDFRASGSKNNNYKTENIDIRCVEAAFDICTKIGSQTMAVDFIFNKAGEPLLIETSYGSLMDFYDECEGYWDKDLKFYPGSFISQNWMIDDVINEIKNK